MYSIAIEEEQIRYDSCWSETNEEGNSRGQPSTSQQVMGPHDCLPKTLGKSLQERQISKIGLFRAEVSNFTLYVLEFFAVKNY